MFLIFGIVSGHHCSEADFKFFVLIGINNIVFAQLRCYQTFLSLAQLFPILVIVPLKMVNSKLFCQNLPSVLQVRGVEFLGHWTQSRTPLQEPDLAHRKRRNRSLLQGLPVIGHRYSVLRFLLPQPPILPRICLGLSEIRQSNSPDFQMFYDVLPFVPPVP